MRILILFATALLLLASPAARAQAPTPIEEWPQSKVIAMGREIYAQDVAAWVATDALLAKYPGQGPAGLRGWVVTGSGAERVVRFVKTDGQGVASGWDVPVSDGKAGEVQEAASPLSETETAMFRARQTAAANIGALRCGGNMNSVVAADPDTDGWLVWLLASTADANVIPIGGHYRFRISADGRAMQTRDQLQNSCFLMPLQSREASGRPTAMVVRQITSRGPVETHVFLSLQNRIPIYVAAGDKLFAVEGARIREVRQ